jgi:hypothetical protein
MGVVVLGSTGFTAEVVLGSLYRALHLKKGKIALFAKHLFFRQVVPVPVSCGAAKTTEQAILMIPGKRCLNLVLCSVEWVAALSAFKR